MECQSFFFRLTDLAIIISQFWIPSPNLSMRRLAILYGTFGGEMMSIQGKNKYSITKMEVALSTWEIGWS